MSVFRRRRHHVYGGGGVTPFSPLDIAGIALWLDAADAATITQTAGAVSQWDDKSGNNNHALQVIGLSQPTTGTRTINSLNTIDFDGSSDFMLLTSALSRTNGYTVYIVCQVDDTGTTKAFFSGSAPGALYLRSSTTEGFVIVRQNQAVLLTGSTTGIVTPSIASFKSHSTGNIIRVNGVSNGSNATNNALTSDVTVFGISDGSNFLDAGIAEVLVYSANLSTANENLLGAYLADKWGITWTTI